MKNLLLLLAIIGLTGTVSPLLAQSTEEYLPPESELSTHLISVGLLGGSLMPHYDFMRTYQRDAVNGICLNIEKVLQGGWASEFSYISRGLEVTHGTLGHADILGRATHVVSYANIGIHSKGKGRFKLGLGIGLLTERFDIEENYKNIAIGSRSNATLLLEYSFPLYTHEKFIIRPAVKITHYSNAAFKLPNLGLNFLLAGLNVQWGIKNYAISPQVEQLPDTKQRLSLTASYGRNEARYIGQEAIDNFGVNVQWVFFKNKLVYGLGLDAHKSKEWDIDRIDFIPSSDPDELKSTVRIGSSAIVGLKVGHTELHLTTGLYIHDDLALNGTIYNRLYILTPLSKKLGVRVRFGVKTHKSKAETIELGLSKDLFKK